MPNVGLALSALTMTYRQGGHMSSGWAFSFSASVSHGLRDEVELTTDDKFVDLEGSVGFRDDSEGEPFEGHPLGSLSYWKGYDDILSPTGPSYLVELRLPRADLDKITAYAVSGYLPRSVGITVPMEYGWAPDGSMKKWDNLKSPVLPIEDFTLWYGHDEVDHDDEMVADDTLISSSSGDDNRGKELRTLISIGRYILIALVIIAFLLAFR